MTERPILFSAEMVKAILGGCKTQTRRVIKPREIERMEYKERATWTFNIERFVKHCPYGKVGDRLWVRESWRKGIAYSGLAVEYKADLARTYLDDYPDNSTDWFWLLDMPWQPSIFMPRWASRITLEVTGVKIEKLHHIGELSAKAEGIDPKTVVSVDRFESYDSYCAAYTELWDSINGKTYPWESDPWVWVIEFKRVK